MNAPLAYAPALVWPVICVPASQSKLTIAKNRFTLEFDCSRGYESDFADPTVRCKLCAPNAGSSCDRIVLPTEDANDSQIVLENSRRYGKCCCDRHHYLRGARVRLMHTFFIREMTPLHSVGGQEIAAVRFGRGGREVLDRGEGVALKQPDD